MQSATSITHKHITYTYKPAN